jgi:protein arginine N-methyltransferase 1
MLRDQVWDSVYGFNMQSIKKMALMEPLVDTVNAKQVNSKACKLMGIDIMTVREEDLTFNVPFKIAALREDTVHALVAWFDIEFSFCHRPIRFSTGPHAEYTHWKQTVFYTNDALPVRQGDVIEGTFAMAPHPRNPRDLNIDISYSLASHGNTIAAGEQHYVLR